MVPTVVREWLAEFKVLSAEEVHSYAASVRHNAELITSLHAVFDEHSNSEILDPICHQLFEFHRCDEKELQRFSLELIPTLIWLYLSMISKGDKARKVYGIWEDGRLSYQQCIHPYWDSHPTANESHICGCDWRNGAYAELQIKGVFDDHYEIIFLVSP